MSPDRSSIRTRAARVLAGALTALLIPAAVASADPSNTVDATFSTPGCANTFEVPAGVTQLHVEAIGERGGGLTGGAGADLVADVNSGGFSSLEVCVGAGGGAGGTSSANGVYTYSAGKAGGGYSSIGESGQTPFLLAAGGGGESGSESGPGAAGGNAGAGALPAVDGSDADGTGGLAASGNLSGSAGTPNGFNGYALLGGIGGNGNSVNGGGGGGGGGAGLAGGGGGGGGNELTPIAAPGGGGGGGSSQCVAPATCTSETLDTAGSVPQVSVSYSKLATVTTAGAPVSVVAPAELTLFSAGVSNVRTRGSDDFGTVTFSVDGVAVCTDRAVTNAHPNGLGGVASSSGGIATCLAAAPLSFGVHTLTVAYSGIDAFLASNSAPVPFTVGGPITTLSAEGLDLGSTTTGTTSSTQTVTVTNAGTTRLYVGDYAGALAARPAMRSLGHGIVLEGADKDAFKITADACSGDYLDPSETCDVSVTFTPSRTGAHSASLAISDTAISGPDTVTLTGTGADPVAPPPAPTPTPEPPTVTKPVAPPTATTSAVPSVTLAPSAGGKATVTRANDVVLPLTCPAGEVCKASGTMTLEASGARAAATSVLARFKDITVRGGQVRRVKLHLPRSFVLAAQKAGKRSVTATLRITTTLGSGGSTTRSQRVRLLIPRAAAKKQAAQPKFTG